MNLSAFFTTKYKNYKLLYHITSRDSAENILKNNFDIKRSKMSAFGRGVNMTDDIDHLAHYYDKKRDTVVVSLVKYNKLKQNPSYFKDINSKESQAYIKKYGHSKPTYMNVPKGYDGFRWKSIYVIKNTRLIRPMLIMRYDAAARRATL